MAEESGAATDFPVKRQREDEELNNHHNHNHNGVEMEGINDNNSISTNKESEYISTIIPGWFSEISPMWPGGFLIIYIYVSFLGSDCF